MNFARLALYASALAMVSASVAVAAPAYVLTNVNLRSGPGTTNEIVGRIPGGSRVEANNCKDGWCEVSWNGKNGFAIQTALDLSGRAPVRRRTYGPGYVGPPVYYPPSPYYYGPAPYYYYGPRYYYGYGPYWRRRHWW